MNFRGFHNETNNTKRFGSFSMKRKCVLQVSHKKRTFRLDNPGSTVILIVRS